MPPLSRPGGPLSRLLDAPALRAARARGAGVIALYHRVSDATDAAYAPMATALFSYHLDQLTRAFTLISLGELVERVTAGKGVAGCCSLTFDDGFRDFIDSAYPVLEARGVPVTHFLVSELVRTGQPTWNYRLNRILAATGETAAANRWKRELGRWAPEARERWLVERERPEMPPLPPMLTAADARATDPAIVEWGSHTRSHASLPWCDDAGLTTELAESRHELSTLLQRPIRFVSYPNGFTDARVGAAAKAAGYTAAFAVGQRAVTEDVDGFAFPRFGLDGLAPGRLGLEVCGLWPALRTVRGAVGGAPA